ncbi:putative lipoprotein [Xenorhabdus bovienii str. feltiae Florida]|uniref:Putative lipoprotein n=2 Tax=Xenorhabdus bovienii TaxID=40576 RepID=A0A077NXK8_XENBV|nr:putative lipoprotein [Xenorhabdus bovienii str. feltiae France]CDG90820.1 putative lipoprotein [Xenorhabdus bovienii str. feltiae Florida]CDH03208.1 putative lipoprotein [Xenorhabdus bovienii str. feltiae Moldova]
MIATVYTTCINISGIRILNEKTYMLKKIFTSLLALFFLAGLSGCANSGNTLAIQPKITLPPVDPTMKAITISISGVDHRQSQALAQVNRDARLVTLTPSRDLRFLLQEALEKQMVARGYMIGSPANANLQVVVNQLYANVKEGSLRHDISTKAEISIIVYAQDGSQQIKNYRTSYNVQGPLSATNAKIADAVNTVLSDVIADMAQDSSVSTFIKQNVH